MRVKERNCSCGFQGTPREWTAYLSVAPSWWRLFLTEARLNLSSHLHELVYVLSLASQGHLTTSF